MQQNRLTQGGFVNRGKPISFRFDGKQYQGFEGDTLASALLANNVRLVGRSFKYHRKRGIFADGPEEPNALVTVKSNGPSEPNTRATMLPIYEGLDVSSQNAWPSLNWDLMSVNQWAAPFLGAGFYYKTFMGPVRQAWMFYEKFIRRAAGLGKASYESADIRFEKNHVHVDALVIGAGPYGLETARQLTAKGLKIWCIDERHFVGGSSDIWSTSPQQTRRWVEAAIKDIEAGGGVIKTRTTAFGIYDENTVGVVELIGDLSADFDPKIPLQKRHVIKAGAIVIATGAIEQPLPFGRNDKPGVMLASAFGRYVKRYGVAPAQNPIIVTNNSSAYAHLPVMQSGRIRPAAIVDIRDVIAAEDTQILLGAPESNEPPIDTPVFASGLPVRGAGRHGLRGLYFMHQGKQKFIETDGVLVSGGWQPTLHLITQRGLKPQWSVERNCHLPPELPKGLYVCGAAAGDFGNDLDIATVSEMVRTIINDSDVMNVQSVPQTRQPTGLKKHTYDIDAKTLDVEAAAKGKIFIDLQNDVTAKDIRQAAHEGYVSVEHMKRYTTTGMATDQGKTGNLLSLQILADSQKIGPKDIGTTAFRPPYTPVAIGALAGPDVGAHFRPLRRTPMDAVHTKIGTEWIDNGLWRRPRYYPKLGETIHDAYTREVAATRGSVGISDVSTLGKIDIQGPDAAAFLDKVYSNTFSTLPIGKARYGIMLRQDGFVDDDGTTSRLSENHYFMTTTTGHAGKVMVDIEYARDVLWPDMKVHLSSVSDQWAGIAIAGPNARRLLEQFIDIDISNDAFPFMAVGECAFQTIPARLFRISFSGELAYEINIPADFGPAVWDALLNAQTDFDITPYGLEALGTMRIEKGHVVASELNGRTTADDVGLGKMAGSKKAYIGRALKDREELAGEGRKQLVGLKSVTDGEEIIPGAQLIELEDRHAQPPVEMLGHVTSSAYSPELDCSIGLALVKDGRQRHGDRVMFADPLRDRWFEVEIIDPVFIDKKGERLRG